MAKIFWKLKDGELVLIHIVDLDSIPSQLSSLSVEELRKIVIKFD